MMDADLHRRTQQRAYELWEQEGRPEGRAEDHWSRAEAEILAEAGAPEPAAPEPGPGAPEPGADEPPRAGPGPRRGTGRRRRATGSPTEPAPSDLTADEAAKGGGGVGP